MNRDRGPHGEFVWTRRAGRDCLVVLQIGQTHRQPQRLQRRPLTRSPPTAALNIIGQHARQLGRPRGRPNLSLSFSYQEAFGHFGRLTHRRSCQNASEPLRRQTQ